jgi:hypothetical protein
MRFDYRTSIWTVLGDYLPSSTWKIFTSY